MGCEARKVCPLNGSSTGHTFVGGGTSLAVVHPLSKIALKITHSQKMVSLSEGQLVRMNRTLPTVNCFSFIKLFPQLGKFFRMPELSFVPVGLYTGFPIIGTDFVRNSKRYYQNNHRKAIKSPLR